LQQIVTAGKTGLFAKLTYTDFYQLLLTDAVWLHFEQV